MTGISRVKLFGKLNRLGYKTIESATLFCKLRGNPYVELIHWLHLIIQNQDSDLHRIVRHFGMDAARLAADFTTTLDKLPRGHASISDISSAVDDAIERGWVYGTLAFGDGVVRTGHLMVGCLKTAALRDALFAISGEFRKINPDTLMDEFARIVGGSVEDDQSAGEGLPPGGGPNPAEDSGAMAPAQMGKQEALRKFTVDLTARARAGEMDPVLGRDEEIRQIVDILMRRRQNNPILTGEAGVGKTAVVEGFAQRIINGDMPPQLKNVSLYSLDIGLLQAGASMKGEFESRLRQVIDEVQASVSPIILFMDEAHTLIGAGGAAGTGDAANLLKPALARGRLRIIAATTWAEYKKYFEKDPALTRRFQIIQVNEPSEHKAIMMLRGMASVLEKHHGVQVLDEAIEAAVRLSRRYIPARQLPDKAVGLLDTACARVAVSQHATPAELEDAQRQIESLEIEMAIIGREEAVGVNTGKRKDHAQIKLAEAKEKLSGLERRWLDEKNRVGRVIEIRAMLCAGADASPCASHVDDARASLLEELKKLQDDLATLQGNAPLILPSCDEQAVASVVQDWTGIPVGRIVRDEIEAVLKLADNIGKRIIGQHHALEMIARRIQTSRAGLDNPDKPIGVFMLAGTSGVGKTETALALAESLYGGEQNVITINMSEYQEAHSVSTLKGAPPGYVGYGEGGVLTEAVRRCPYSIVLLDEVEKSHPDIHEIFFQVFDKGWMEDGEGRVIDFRNTLILLTTNAGSDMIMDMCKDPDMTPEYEDIANALRVPLLEIFPAALLGRVVVIPYYPLSDEMIAAITRLQLERVKERIIENHKVIFTYDDEVIRLIASRCTGLESGGRMIDAILTNTILPKISEEFLLRMMAGKPVDRVHVGVQDGELWYGYDQS